MTRAERLRLETLLLLIEPTIEDQQELKRLQKHFDQRRWAATDADPYELDHPDPDYRAARLDAISSELFYEARRRDERICAAAERATRERGKEMNKHRL